MTTKSDTTRFSLQRDITEALLRLKLARAKRDRKDTKECQEKLDWLLDRLAIHLNLEGGS